AIDKIEGFPAPLKTVVQHLLISHHGQYEFGSPKLPMIREALVFHYLDDLDSKLSAARVALATPSGDDEWSAYSSALGRRFLNLDQFLNPEAAEATTATPASAASAAGASTATKPSANTPGSQPPSLRPPLESSQSNPAPKPKSEQSFFRKLFS